MLKPAGAACNLACEYCYYTEKCALYPGGSFRMDEATLERVTAAYLQANPAPEVVFGWQGGEPLLMGREFYARALALQAQYLRPGQRALNALQTNGVLIDDDWARFFAEHGFLIGISLDGPPELHDRYRRDGAGAGTYARVREGLRALQRHGVEHNALVTVNRANVEHPRGVYRHLVDLGLRHLQFIPVVERAAPSSRKVTPWTVRPEPFGEFLCEVFDEWASRDVGRVFVQLFESTLNVWLGRPATLCSFSPICGTALAVEHTGDVYACDHFVYPEFRRGNAMTDDLATLVEGKAQRAFGQAKADLSDDCRRCPVLALCQGDCPKHRIRVATDGKPISYLCVGYRRFFSHSAARLRELALDLDALAR